MEIQIFWPKNELSTTPSVSPLSLYLFICQNSDTNFLTPEWTFSMTFLFLHYYGYIRTQWSKHDKRYYFKLIRNLNKDSIKKHGDEIKYFVFYYKYSVALGLITHRYLIILSYTTLNSVENKIQYIIVLLPLREQTEANVTLNFVHRLFKTRKKKGISLRNVGLWIKR